ncbi:PE-PGRS family protein [Dietzia sp. SLG310A2-38A2]|uniref:PE-PGRS family protein n=1 Tax=Dietzia sp. SLG310A2-38A2 TaxID=1630643 RepID=UPI0015FC0CA5|nr:PE-PGRS family protein [Dietzia sp. SLG310A2-38A2]MBB1031239.1 PE-PGRS family protein [Dietzia sp. SLG310A2-38A2]
MSDAGTNDSTDLASAFAVLSDFLGTTGLTAHLAQVESKLVEATATEAGAVASQSGLTDELLVAALSVRAKVGRLNDVIHASAIAVTLPHILEPGEQVTNRPSLGAGNDETRPFDLETDRRIAEFKIAQWKGADTMRKRGVFKDLVYLALDDSGRRAQLYVVGELPGRFLTTSAAKGLWALGRSSPHIRARFTERFDPHSTMTVAEFTAGPAAHIEVIDLRALVPALA